MQNQQRTEAAVSPHLPTLSCHIAVLPGFCQGDPNKQLKSNPLTGSGRIATLPQGLAIMGVLAGDKRIVAKEKSKISTRRGIKMGRPTFFRQRILTQAASLEAKGLFNYLVSEIKTRREVSLEEAILIAYDVQKFLEEHLLEKPLGQIQIPAIAGINNHRKRSRENQEETLIKVTIFAEEDIELMAEFGIAALQKGRLARIIEEAYQQESLLDGQRLMVLIPRTLRAIRTHLQEFWEKGVLLPVSGMTVENRKKMQDFRSTLALEHYLQGQNLLEIRKEFSISHSLWQKIWQGFKETIKDPEGLPETIAKRIHQPQETIQSWQALWERYKDNTNLRQRLGLTKIEEETQTETRGLEAFYRLLKERHGYSQAAAEAFIDDLYDIAAHLNRQERQEGQIIYNAVSSHEPAGRKLSECELKAVSLNYIVPEDWEVINRDSAKDLKWERLKRLATEAHYQGVALTQPDLSLLLGISTSAIQNCLKEHPTVILPTRGMLADMGPAISHADKIIRLYMDGYTETEIKRRTGHSYDSIEKYLLDFARVTYLLEKGMPIPAIRKVLGCSRKLVEKHVNLYREFSNPDYAFMMAKIRRLAEAHPVKKN
jgi:hypothetical protein